MRVGGWRSGESRKGSRLKKGFGGRFESCLEAPRGSLDTGKSEIQGVSAWTQGAAGGGCEKAGRRFRHVHVVTAVGHPGGDGEPVR